MTYALALPLDTTLSKLDNSEVHMFKLHPVNFLMKLSSEAHCVGLNNALSCALAFPMALS